MITHLNDWRYYPNAIPDFKTSNSTFIDLVEVYYRMGVKNHLFILALHNPELQGVDPHDEKNLTLRQKALILKESKENYWYYLREIVRIPVKGSNPIQFMANRANIAMYWCFFNNIDYANILPRQCGKSVGADVLNDWILHIGGYNQTVQLFTHSVKLRKENIARLKAIRDTKPEFMNFYNDKEDFDNTEGLSCKLLKNYYLTAVSQKDASEATRIGRGMTSAIIQADELPFCSNAGITWAAMMGSTSAAIEAAERNGTMYGNIITTTAGNRLTKDGKFAYQLIHGGMDWTERLLDTETREEAWEMVQDHSRSTKETGNRTTLRMVNGTFSALQIGKSKEWLRSRIEKAMTDDPAEARRDYLNEWTVDTKESPLDKKIHLILTDTKREPEFIQLFRGRFTIKWFVPEEHLPRYMDNVHTVIGVDTADMSGKDANGLVIVDLRDMSVVGVSEVKTGSLIEYGNWIADLLITYPKTTLVMERKSSAPGLIDGICTKLYSSGIDPFKRMYNRIVDNPEKNHSRWMELQQGEGRRDSSFWLSQKDQIGFMTTGSSRSNLYGVTLQHAANSSAHVVRDEGLTNQLQGLIYKNGRVDHPVGGHDDLCIAWLLCHWFASNARNHKWYDIPPGYCQSLVSEDGATLSKDQLEIARKNKEILQRIDVLKKQMRDESSPTMKKSLEMKINFLADHLSDEHQRASVLDDLMTDMEEKTKEKRSLRKQLENMRKRRQLRAA